MLWKVLLMIRFTWKTMRGTFSLLGGTGPWEISGRRKERKERGRDRAEKKKAGGVKIPGRKGKMKDKENKALTKRLQVTTEVI